MFILRPLSTKVYELSDSPTKRYLTVTSSPSSQRVMQLGLGFFVHLTTLYQLHWLYRTV
jgi:hypothetical protein